MSLSTRDAALLSCILVEGFSDGGVLLSPPSLICHGFQPDTGATVEENKPTAQPWQMSFL